MTPSDVVITGIAEADARSTSIAGVPLLINCDAHRTSGFEVVRYGVATARRAWLTPSQIANTESWTDLAALRRRP